MKTNEYEKTKFSIKIEKKVNIQLKNKKKKTN